jgi:hypothetical protein
MKIKQLILVTASMLFIGCSDSRWYRAFELDESTFDSEAMQMVENDSGLDLPNGSTGLHFRYRPPIDPAFIAQIEIPKDAKDDIRKQIESMPNEEINVSGGLRESTAWWRPSDESVIIERQYYRAENEYLKVVLTDKDQHMFLYVDHSIR